MSVIKDLIQFKSNGMIRRKIPLRLCTKFIIITLCLYHTWVLTPATKLGYLNRSIMICTNTFAYLFHCNEIEDLWMKFLISEHNEKKMP